MDKFLQDFRYGIRSLRKMPLLTLAALACIAIGVGATVSVFTLINTTLLQGLPYPEPDRLVRVWTTSGPEDQRRGLSYLDYQDVSRESSTLDRLEASARTRLTIINEVGVERTRGESVTPGMFDLIGMEPVVGRLFTADEYAAEAPDLIVIGYDLWQRRFGGSRDVVGATLEARGSWGGRENTNRPYQVIGVLPEGFTGTVEDDVSEFWLPISHYEPRENLESRTLRVMWSIGRLAEGTTVAAADQEIATIGRALAQEFGEEDEDFGARVEPLGENWREDLRAGLYLLLGASFLLLLIACTNIANLLLARLARRRHELTVRLVMGAGRTRVLRQLLTESLALAAIGGAIGVGLAYLFVKVYMDLAREDVPGYVAVSIDWRVVVLSLLVVGVTGILFGVLPAWLGSRVDASSELKEDGRGASGGRRQRRFGQVLVATEVALTLVLLLAASLMFRSFRNLETVDLGYDVQNLMRMSTTLDRTVYQTPDDWAQARREAKQVIARQPGVLEVAAAAGVLPPSRDMESTITFATLEGEYQDNVYRHPVDADFFETMDIAVLHGRPISEVDRGDAARVAVVSESLARLVSGGEARGAVGEQIQFLVPTDPPQTSQPYEVVGVAEDALYDGPLSDRPYDYDLYLSLEQVPDYLISFAVRTAGPPENYMEGLTREVSRVVDPSPVHWVQTMREMLSERYSDTRFYTLLIVVYSLSAVLLAIIGIYGVLANSVNRRLREMGIRVAIGARRGHLMRMVVGQSMRTVLVGVVLGLAIAFAGARLLSSFMYGVSVTDTLTFVLVVAGLLLLAVLASYLPARRATRVDPVVALRNE